MKRFLILPLALLAFTLAGCSGDSVFRGGTSLTATVQNPVGRRELAVVYDSYLIAGKTYVSYRDLGICRSGTVETLFNPCARRDVLLSLQAHDRRAYAALVTAGRFVRNNPNISGLSAVNAARAAVTDYQTALTSAGAR